MIQAPKATGRFIEFDGYIYHMDAPIYDRLVAMDVEFEIPIVQLQSLHAGAGGVRVGYRFLAPMQLAQINVNYVMICRAATTAWEPIIGLPGFQVYGCEFGVCLIASRMTPFLTNLVH